jgi:ATP-dependent Clp endopeptidase proteolytic subunit ClpP
MPYPNEHACRDRGFSITCQGQEAEIVLYDVLDPWFGISARTIHQRLKEAGDIKRIRVRINSPGGSIFEGGAIHNLLKTHPARVVITIDGLAASMASLVAMAGDEIEMGEAAYLMIHDPTAQVRGDAGEIREMAELLDKMKAQLVGIYARRTGQSEAQIAQWMADETWMTAQEAVDRRFADRAVIGLKVAASTYDLSETFRHVPENLFLENSEKEKAAMADDPNQGALHPATLKELRPLCPGADEKFLCAQLDAEATPEQAGKAWTAEQGRRLEAANQKAAAAEAKLAEAEKKATAGKSGVEPLGNGSKGPAGETAGDAIEAWDRLIAGYVAGGTKRPKAIARAAREHPEAHAAYVAAYNEKHGHPAGRFA